MGASGLSINLLIAHFYGPTIVGIYNQIFSIYLVFSQLAALGIQFSVLRSLSYFTSDSNKQSIILSSAMMLTMATATLICFIFNHFMLNIGSLFDSEGVTTGLLYIAPGIWCFAINKILFNGLNGIGRMKGFAITHALRLIFMLFCIICGMMYGLSGEQLPIALSVAELLTLVSLLYCIRDLLKFPSFPDTQYWIQQHLIFGTKSLPGGLIHEFNTRLDILFLGYFLSDKIVGLYSLASIVIEGMVQLVNVVRHNINAHIAPFLTDRNKEDLAVSIRKTVGITYRVAIVTALVTLILYPLLLSFALETEDLTTSWKFLFVMLAGLVAGAGYRPFEMILSQGGFPGWQTILRILVVTTHILLSLVLIPIIGAPGAAIATALTFISSAIYLKLATLYTLNIRI